ncbi:MAG: hypothetical protein ACI4V7_04270 [Succinivibrionaceae bacterium]
MLLLHLTPFNSNLTPWLLDYAILDDNCNLSENGEFKQLIIKPAMGISPSPRYAVAFDEDCTSLLKQKSINLLEAGNKLVDIIKSEEVIIFSNTRSLCLFKKLCVRLLLPDLLVNKKVSCFKSLLSAAIFFKNTYELSSINKIKELAKKISSEQNNISVIKATAIILKDIYQKESKLLNYFLQKNFKLNSDYLSNHKIFVALNESNFYIFTPFLNKDNYIYAFDLLHNNIPIKLPLFGGLLFTVGSVITNGILRFLNTGAEQITNTLNDLNQIQFSGDFITQNANYADANEKESDQPIDINAFKNAFNDSDILDNSQYHDLIEKRKNISLLIDYLGKLSGNIREAVLDYIADDYCDILPYVYLESYKSIVEKRILNTRDSFIEEFNILGNKYKDNKTITTRLENLYNFLSM